MITCDTLSYQSGLSHVSIFMKLIEPCLSRRRRWSISVCIAIESGKITRRLCQCEESVALQNTVMINITELLQNATYTRLRPLKQKQFIQTTNDLNVAVCKRLYDIYLSYRESIHVLTSFLFKQVSDFFPIANSSLFLKIHLSKNELVYLSKNELIHLSKNAGGAFLRTLARYANRYTYACRVHAYRKLEFFIQITDRYT